jgi:alpha-glucoside transport system substrate-binding protein
MTTSRKGVRFGFVAGLAALALVATACGGDDGGESDDTSGGGTETTAASGGTETTAASGGTETTAGGGEAVDLSGETVSLLGTEVGTEADGVIAGLAAFEEATGATAEWTGTRDAETQVRTAAEAGGDALPDIFFAPQPGLVKALVDYIAPLPADVLAAVEENYDPYFKELVTVDGNVLGVPVKGDVKSLVWYSPSAFSEAGYAVPTTWDELIALQDQIVADGGTPWCIGIESGDATGWPFTDWMEDIMLRLHGPEVYDQWVNHEIPFNDPKVLEVAEMVGDIWFADGNVAGGRESIASTGFASAGLGITDGSCYMHRQANFFGANFKEANPEIVFGEEGDVNVFYLPTMSDEFGQVLLSAGVYAVAFNDEPATQAMMAHLASPAYANARIEANKGGYLSPNRAHDTSLYADELDRTLADILVTADPVRFDASDLMPAEVGAGSFWKEGTNFVSGTIDAQEFVDNVEASWPAS